MTEKKERPQDRWNKKAGYISKSYRLYRKDTDAFKETCERLGVSQAGTITKLIREFVEQNKEQ
jgi:hypothetical protein